MMPHEMADLVGKTLSKIEISEQVIRFTATYEGPVCQPRRPQMTIAPVGVKASKLRKRGQDVV